MITNSARVAFYLRDLHPRLDRPLGFGTDAEQACGPRCPHRARDRRRCPGTRRASASGPGTRRFSARSTSGYDLATPNRPPVGFNWRVDPLTCSLAMLVSAALGGGADARALPVTVQDDALMLHRPPAEVQETARRMARLGVDRVRLTASWSALAPGPGKKRMPRFDATNSEDVPARAVGTARPRREGRDQRGPRSADGRRILRTALGRREVGADELPRPPPLEARPGAVRPVRRGRRPPLQRHPSRPNAAQPAPARGASLDDVERAEPWCVPPTAMAAQRRPLGTAVAAHLPQAARTRVCRDQGCEPGEPGADRRHGSPGRPGTRPAQGHGAAAVPPRARLRRPAWAPLERHACDGFKPLQADGWAHHPYSLYDRPDVASVNPDDVQMGDLERLSRLLDRLHRLGRITTRLPIFLTEYGYETNPPDVERGVTLRQQARYHGLATYLAWQQQDISMFAQFLLNDIAPPPGAENDPVEASRDWHSGLYFHDGQPKQPAIQAFKLPFWAETRSLAGNDVVVLFGQVRPSEGRKRIEVEMHGADGTWIPIQTYETRPAGDLSLRDGDDLLPDRLRGFLPAARALPGAELLPRALDQDRWHIRVRRVCSGWGTRARAGALARRPASRCRCRRRAAATRRSRPRCNAHARSRAGAP